MNKNRSSDELIEYIRAQIKNFFICDMHIEKDTVKVALNRTKRCFNRSVDKYYFSDEFKSALSLLHSGQYSIFLYYLSNELYKCGYNEGAQKIYYLNKVLHSVDWFYEIELPEYWGVEHPLGSVLGRAEYSNGLFLYQGCTVGGSYQGYTVGGSGGMYPIIGKNVIMSSYSSILGNSKIGNNVVLSAGAMVKNQNIPSNCLVYGQTPNIIIKSKSAEEMKAYISNFWKLN